MTYLIQIRDSRGAWFDEVPCSDMDHAEREVAAIVAEGGEQPEDVRIIAGEILTATVNHNHIDIKATT